MLLYPLTIRINRINKNRRATSHPSAKHNVIINGKNKKIPEDAVVYNQNCLKIASVSTGYFIMKKNHGHVRKNRFGCDAQCDIKKI